MEAREAFERFEHNLSHHGGMELARSAAVAVAVMAAFLAVSTFLSNESIKEAINGETRASSLNSLLAANEEKVNQAEANILLLRVVARASERENRAAQGAMAIDARIERRLKPIDARLREQVKHQEHERDHANSDHLIYELSQVGLQLGIVLASVAIIASRRWLLYGGCGCGVVGAVLLVVGLLN
jgi:uncharacterized protein DUF4337